MGRAKHMPVDDQWCTAPSMAPLQVQVVECRRILKWTYAYGYYSFQPAEERRKGSPPAATKEQQGFFEFNQACLNRNALHIGHELLQNPN